MTGFQAKRDWSSLARRQITLLSPSKYCFEFQVLKGDLTRKTRNPSTFKNGNLENFCNSHNDQLLGSFKVIGGFQKLNQRYLMYQNLEHRVSLSLITLPHHCWPVHPWVVVQFLRSSFLSCSSSISLLFFIDSFSIVSCLSFLSCICESLVHSVLVLSFLLKRKNWK